MDEQERNAEVERRYKNYLALKALARSEETAVRMMIIDRITDEEIIRYRVAELERKERLNSSPTLDRLAALEKDSHPPAVIHFSELERRVAALERMTDQADEDRERLDTLDADGGRMERVDRDVNILATRLNELLRRLHAVDGPFGRLAKLESTGNGE